MLILIVDVDFQQTSTAIFSLFLLATTESEIWEDTQSLLSSTGLWDSTTSAQYSSNNSDHNMTKNRDYSSTHIQRYYWILISISTACIMVVLLFAWILGRKLLCCKLQRNSGNETNAVEMEDVRHTADEETETNPKR